LVPYPPYSVSALFAKNILSFSSLDFDDEEGGDDGGWDDDEDGYDGGGGDDDGYDGPLVFS
jgi:hypothetical protein